MAAPIQPETSTTLPPASEPATDPFAEQREAVRQQVLAEAAQVYGAGLADAERRAREATEALNASRNTPATPTPPVDSATYFADPETHNRRMIQEELAKAVAPLNQLAQETRNQNAYMTAKGQLRMHPNVGQHLQQIEHILDQEARFLQQVDMNSVGALAVNIIGRAYAGMIPGVTLGAVAPVISRQVPPPQVPPSAARTPAPTPAVIELTEQQRAVARFQGLSDEQYIALLNSDGSLTGLRAVK